MLLGFSRVVRVEFLLTLRIGEVFPFFSSFLGLVLFVAFFPAVFLQVCKVVGEGEAIFVP